MPRQTTLKGSPMTLAGHELKPGDKAPDFTLTDAGNKSVSLAELLAAPLHGATPRGVLLVFYRGYW